MVEAKEKQQNSRAWRGGVHAGGQSAGYLEHCGPFFGFTAARDLKHALLTSAFGVMFFGDRVVAFTNVWSAGASD